MATYEYPSNIYDQPRLLLASLGSFWSEVYEAHNQVLSYVTAKAQVEQQTQLDLLELIASMSRYTVPIFHRDSWYLLTLKESERNGAKTSLAKFDDGTTFNDGEQFDVPVRRPGFAFPRPSQLVFAPHVMNRFTEPSLVWTSGVDYMLSDNAIIFYTDPFLDDRVGKQSVYDGNGAVIDREASVWIFRGEFDWQHAYQQFGYAVGVYMKSSKGYRDLLNAIYNSLVGGTTRQQIETAMSVITGVPLVLEHEETVVDISVDHTYRLIITDKNVYKFRRDVTVTVAVGDVLHAGDSLTDALRFTEFNRGITPDDLQALSVGKGFLATCFYADLVFENKEVPLEVITNDPSGMTKLKFGLGGFPADVEQFFDELHERGIVASQAPVDACDPGEIVSIPGSECDDVPATTIRRGTLAHHLDKRDAPVGEPTAASLPRTINPLQFLVANVLRNNAFLVRVKAAGIGSTALGLQHVRLLHKIIPPHTAMILLIELTLVEDSVTVDQLNDDELETFTGAEPLDDAVTSAYVNDDDFSAHPLAGHCH